MDKLKDRVALVTGAGSGIGRAIALRFASEGAQVSVIDINQGSSDEVSAAILSTGGRAVSIPCDVTKEEQVERAVSNTVSSMGNLHILVNNAGISSVTPLEKLELNEWSRILAVNLTGPFLFMKAAFPYITKAGVNGRCITIGSLAGQAGGIAVGIHYTASKGGVMAMTKQLAKLLAPYRATANCIAPGTADTPLVRDWPEETRRSLINQIPLGRLAAPEDVAGTALFLASDDGQFITGATINVNGGMLIT